MDILRVVQDGVEFFTHRIDGACDMSESGLARICDVSRQSMQEKIHNALSGKSTPECLKEFVGRELPCQVTLKINGLPISVVLIPSDLCAAMIEYYAFESRYKTKSALFAYRKFAKMGIERWIQGITGWQPPQLESPEDPKLILPKLELDREGIRQIINQPLSPSCYRLYLHLHDIGELGQRPPVPTICKQLQISPTTFYKTARKLKELNLLPDWVVLETRNYPESFIRDWLHRELGGQIEAPTPYGPIDLLTDDSVIEIKAVEDWKEAIGHVMVKVAAHPKLTPCLMLFGDRVNNFDRIRESCQRLKIELGCLLVKYIYNGANELQEVQRVQVFL